MKNRIMLSFRKMLLCTLGGSQRQHAYCQTESRMGLWPSKQLSDNKIPVKNWILALKPLRL